MTPGMDFALGAMVCFGVGDLIYKRAAATGAKASEFLMLQAWFFMPAVTLYALATGTLHINAGSLWGVPVGVFLFIALTNFVASLQGGGAVSTNAPIFRLNFIITAALAIVVLDEAASPLKFAALGLALVAVWLILASPDGRPGALTGASLVRIAIATVAMALTNFFYKVGLRAGALPETIVALQAWTFASLTTISTLWRNPRFRAPPGVLPYAALAAFALFGAFALLTHGLVQGPASVLVPVAQMSFVITALFGAAIFKEQLDRRKCLGLAVAALALVLFAIG
jgi:drug/metabolite transporter (DMT)-like permease